MNSRGRKVLFPFLRGPNPDSKQNNEQFLLTAAATPAITWLLLLVTGIRTAVLYLSQESKLFPLLDSKKTAGSIISMESNFYVPCLA